MIIRLSHDDFAGNNIFLAILLLTKCFMLPHYNHIQAVLTQIDDKNEVTIIFIVQEASFEFTRDFKGNRSSRNISSFSIT